MPQNAGYEAPRAAAWPTAPGPVLVLTYGRGTTNAVPAISVSIPASRTPGNDASSARTPARRFQLVGVGVARWTRFAMPRRASGWPRWRSRLGPARPGSTSGRHPRVGRTRVVRRFACERGARRLGVPAAPRGDTTQRQSFDVASDGARRDTNSLAVLPAAPLNANGVEPFDESLLSLDTAQPRASVARRRCEPGPLIHDVTLEVTQ